MRASLRNTKRAAFFSTEANGGVYIFDAEGNRTGFLKPKDRYYADIKAGEVDPEGLPQIMTISFNPSFVFVCEPSGRVVWWAKAASSKAVHNLMLLGDIDGDGRREWGFINPENAVVLVSPDGVQLAALPSYSGTRHGVILERPGQPGTLLLYHDGKLRAYTLGSGRKSIGSGAEQ